MSDLVLVVQEVPEGSYVARPVAASTVTEADDLAALQIQLRDAARCHHHAAARAQLIRLRHVRDEGIAA